MKIPEFTFLSAEQCCGENRLRIFDEINLKSKLTSFAYYFGGADICEMNSKNAKYGYYWTKDIIDGTNVIAIGYNHELPCKQNNYTVGIRLAVRFADIENFCSNIKISNKEIMKFEFGEYIQDIVEPNLQNIFNQSDKMIETSHEYKLVNIVNSHMEYISLISYKSLNCGDSEFVKIPVDYLVKMGKNFEFNYQKILSEVGFLWFEIKPIKWIKHENDEYAITDKIITSGIPFNLFDINKHEFSEMYIKYYIDNYLAKEIIQSYKFDDEVMANSDSSTIEKYSYVPVHLDDEENDYGIYLTDNTYTVNPAIGREKEIRNLEKKLLIPKTGVVLVGEAGVGKTAIVEGLAYQIQNGNICDLLKNKGILSVNIGELLSGCKYRGEFEKKVTSLCKTLSTSKNIILFLDEMHMSLGAGLAESSNIDMANMLKTYISNDLIKVIGCTTKAEYENCFVNDKAYRRRFKIIDVNEPDLVVLNNILDTTMKILANKFNINIKLTELENKKIIDSIIKLSAKKQKYMYERLKNPDSSINILTECFAYFVIENIKEAKYQDFIAGIIDNDTLCLSKMEVENWLENDIKIDESIYETNRQKVFSLNRKGN